MRHKLALLALLCGVLTMAACGDDNDTPLATPVPTNTSVPTTPPTPAVPTSTNTVGTPLATVTPTATSPEGTGTPGNPTGTPIAFNCEFQTSFTCVDGARAGMPCRPEPAPNATPAADEICPGATVPTPCVESDFVCIGGPNDGGTCDRPQRTRTPDPCLPGRCSNSELRICTELGCPIISRRNSGGIIETTCNSDGTNCTAKLDYFDGVEIPGIGFICIKIPGEQGTPELTCPAGRFDCTGSDVGLDYDLLQVHTIRDPSNPALACTGNDDCRQDCIAFCDAKGRVMSDFGCTGFCKSGARIDEPCRCDSGTTECTGLNCPEGSCNGKDIRDADPVPNSVCGCQCIDEGGAPSRAGAINFQVPAQIVVETGPPCDSGPVLLTLAPQCIPLTTETSVGVLTNANNNFDCPGGEPADGCTQIPPSGVLSLTGDPVTCERLRAGDVTGMNVVGNISFFDSTIGDLETQLNWTCK
jgi:hypothetical protein